ncbi:basic salivary proline-rich protein 2-like [Choloepus didactylus]|uniref:basic salivary proline-rich protein 2-like n=1 Tax=Choloepus didactylus TaxID=27675 RepID=UPI00189C8DE8|nr:basic salivary proline-rich protein 2-like [Choloepus didactylus]
METPSRPSAFPSNSGVIRPHLLWPPPAVPFSGAPRKNQIAARLFGKVKGVPPPPSAQQNNVLSRSARSQATRPGARLSPPPGPEPGGPAEPGRARRTLLGSRAPHASGERAMGPEKVQRVPPRLLSGGTTPIRPDGNPKSRDSGCLFLRLPRRDAHGPHQPHRCEGPAGRDVPGGGSHRGSDPPPRTSAAPQPGSRPPRSLAAPSAPPRPCASSARRAGDRAPRPPAPTDAHPGRPPRLGSRPLTSSGPGRPPRGRARNGPGRPRLPPAAAAAAAATGSRGGERARRAPPGRRQEALLSRPPPPPRVSKLRGRRSGAAGVRVPRLLREAGCSRGKLWAHAEPAGSAAASSSSPGTPDFPVRRRPSRAPRPPPPLPPRKALRRGRAWGRGWGWGGGAGVVLRRDPVKRGGKEMRGRPAKVP